MKHANVMSLAKRNYKSNPCPHLKNKTQTILKKKTNLNLQSILAKSSKRKSEENERMEKILIKYSKNLRIKLPIMY